MKNYRLYLIRHGITSGNLEGKYIGTTDLPLCEEGEDAISSLAALDVYPKVQKVYSSPLKRCLQTADIIYPERLLKRIDGIAELDFGEYEGKTQAELQSDEKYLEWLKGGYDAAPPNGESYGHFTLRNIQGYDGKRGYISRRYHAFRRYYESSFGIRSAQDEAYRLCLQSGRGI